MSELWNWAGWMYLGRITGGVVAGGIGMFVFNWLLDFSVRFNDYVRERPHLKSRLEKQEATIAQLHAQLAAATEGGPFRSSPPIGDAGQEPK